MQTFKKNDTEALSALFSKKPRTVILTHTHPDGDAIGSTTGMQRFLSSIGVESTVILPDPQPETLLFIRKEESLPIIAASEDMDGARKAVSEAGLIICQDFNTPSRAECLAELFYEAKAEKVLIDHHLNPERESFSLVFSDSEASSASELVFWLLLSLEQTSEKIERIPLGSLEALMTGMTTDTNNFANSTSPETLQMASLCIAAGVDRDAIIANIYQNYRPERFALMGYYLREKLRTTAKGVAYAVFSAAELKAFDIQEGDTEGFVNIPLGMKDIRMSLLLKEQNGAYRVSIRSKKGTSANRCARLHFNGGGHENASGGNLPVSQFDGPESVEKYIETVTDGLL